MNSSSRRSALPEWTALEQHAGRLYQLHLRDLFHHEPERATQFSLRVGALFLDYSKQRIDTAQMAALLALAQAVHLPQAIEALFSGQHVNPSEDRPALHTALRLPRDHVLPLADGADVVPQVHASLDRMRSIVEQIHSRQWRGFSGHAITDVINIGVGGSDLGPLMASHALSDCADARAQSLRLHFVSSIDGTQIADLLTSLRPETSLFLVSSKSFTTVDTMSNARTVLGWMKQAIDDEALLLRHHFIGISADPERMRAWGIPEQNQIVFWDWVGGRFSLWSGIGLPVALRLGMKGFEQMLAGAHAMDCHFRTTALANNLPVLMGLVSVWNASFLDINAQTVLPYDGRLKYLPAYLTQLEMESNGKSVDFQGQRVDYATCPILWGDIGSNAQHAFYQLLHQGTQAVSCEFIAPIRRYDQVQGAARALLQRQQELMLANCLAQSRVLMLGDAALAEPEAAPEFKRYFGNQPSSTLLLDELSPATLGALLAAYEHKVYVMSVLWGINPFDQWGVELGKKIAHDTLHMVQGTASRQADASTDQLVQEIRGALQENPNRTGVSS